MGQIEGDKPEENVEKWESGQLALRVGDGAVWPQRPLPDDSHPR